MEMATCKTCGCEGMLIEAETGIAFDDVPGYTVTCLCKDQAPLKYYRTPQEAAMAWSRKCEGVG